MTDTENQVAPVAPVEHKYQWKGRVIGGCGSKHDLVITWNHFFEFVDDAVQRFANPEEAKKWGEMKRLYAEVEEQVLTFKEAVDAFTKSENFTRKPLTTPLPPPQELPENDPDITDAVEYR